MDISEAVDPLQALLSPSHHRAELYLGVLSASPPPVDFLSKPVPATGFFSVFENGNKQCHKTQLCNYGNT